MNRSVQSKFGRSKIKWTKIADSFRATRLDESQLANEREVIRRQARERRAMHAELCGMQGGVHENVIDRQRRQMGGKGAECSPRPNESSHVTQV